MIDRRESDVLDYSDSPLQIERPSQEPMPAANEGECENVTETEAKQAQAPLIAAAIGEGLGATQPELDVPKAAATEAGEPDQTRMTSVIAAVGEKGESTIPKADEPKQARMQSVVAVVGKQATTAERTIEQPKPTAARKDAFAELKKRPSEQRERRISVHGRITSNGHGGPDVELIDTWVAEQDGRSWSPPRRRTPTPPPQKRKPALFRGEMTLDSWVATNNGRKPKRRAPRASDFRNLSSKEPRCLELPDRNEQKREQARKDAKENPRARTSYRPYHGPPAAATAASNTESKKRKRTPLRARAERGQKPNSDSDKRRDAPRDGTWAYNGLEPQEGRSGE